MNRDFFERFLTYLRDEHTVLLQSYCLSDGRGGYRRETTDDANEEAALSNLENLIFEAEEYKNRLAMSEPTDWKDDCRIDGMAVNRTADGNWIIVPPDQRRLIEECPCCGKVFSTAEKAKLVADIWYPKWSRP